MKFNFKKIVPVIAGAIMLGSTIGMAYAADASYPSQFLDGVVVYGSATTADMTAANDIANHLGELAPSTGSATVSEGWLVRKSGEKLNYGEDFQDIDATIDAGDLSSLLASGTYKETKVTSNTVDYDQYIDFENGGNKIVFETNREVDKEPRETFLKLTSGKNAYTYRIKFSGGIAYDSTKVKQDFELTKIKILGSEWTITDAADTAGSITKLTLMGGTSSATLKSGEKTDLVMGGKTYSVEATVYSSEARLVINGESLTIDEGSTDELADGTVVGVTDIATSTKEATPDMVTFYIGARKLVLENSKKVKLNDKEVDGTTVTITSSSNKLNEIKIAYAPEDDTYVAVGKEWKEPVFGAFKFVFANLDKKTEDIKVSTGPNDGTLSFENSAGNKVTIPFVDDGTAVYPGDNDKKDTQEEIKSAGLTSNGNLLVADNDLCIGNSTVKECKGIKFLVVSPSGEARIIRLKDINMADMEMSFYDETGKRDIDKVAYVNGTNSALDLGFTTISLSVTNENGGNNTGTMKNLTAANINKYTKLDGAMETKLEGRIKITKPDAATTKVEIYSKENNVTSIGEFNMTLDTNKDMIVKDLNPSMEMGKIERDSKTQTGLDLAKWGAIFTWDSDKKDSLTISYPEEKVVANVYVSPINAVVTGGGVIPVVSDANLGDLKTSKNLIVVGGSAVNKVAAELLGVSYPTYGTDSAWATATGVSQNMALIKLFSGKLATGKVALLVAGYEAADTQAAAKALIAGKGEGLYTKSTAGTYSKE